MYRTPVTAADERLRAALAAHADRAHLINVRTALTPDLTEADAELVKLEAKLAAEQRDVRRYERGVWAFLYDVFADRSARLTKEQREAAEAEARYAECVALRDRLREEVTSLGARIDALAGADAELAAARAAKHAAVVEFGGPAAEELSALTTQLEAIEAEVRSIDEALAAGDRAHGTLTRLVEVLSSARNWGAADIMTDSFFVSWAKRSRLDEANNLAGVAQADMTVFRRELGDVGVGLVAEIEGLANHHRFLDTWFDNIFSDFSVQNRIVEAQSTTSTALENVSAVLGQLRARRATVLDRGEQLSKQRLDVIEPR